MGKRLGMYNGQPMNTTNQNYDNTEEEQYIPDEPTYQSPAVHEYDTVQRQAMDEYKKEVDAIEKTNPHTLYKDIITNPSTKGKYEMNLIGRPVDVNALENYLIFKISPRTITTLMRYNDSKTFEEVRGYTKRKHVKFDFKILFTIIMLIIMIVVGVMFFFGSGNVTELFTGMFGM